LGVRYSVGWCGGGDDEWTEDDELELREAEGRAARKIFARCPQLKELWFKDSTKVTNDLSGDFFEAGDKPFREKDGLKWYEIQDHTWI
jgi:hypothetical protein